MRAERAASPRHAGGPSDPPRLFLGDTKVQHNILYYGGMHALCVYVYIEKDKPAETTHIAPRWWGGLPQLPANRDEEQKPDK